MKQLPGIRWIGLAACLLLGQVALAGAKTVEVPEEGIKIDIPDTLSAVARPGTVIAAADANNTSAISVNVFMNSTNQKIQAAYIEGIQDSLQEQGRKAGAVRTEILREGSLTIGGAPAYQIGCVTIFPNGEQVYIHQYPIFANLKTYVVSVQTYDIKQEAKLVAAAMSFRFSDSPDLPDAPDDPHARIGVMMGEDISFIMPSNWFIKNAVNGFDAREVAGTSEVSISVIHASQGEIIDPKTYLEEVSNWPQEEVKGVAIENGQKGPISIGNVPAYFFQYVVTGGGTKKMYCCRYVFLANQKAYMMTTLTDDLDKVPLVEKIARSMRIGAGMTAEQVAALAATPAPEKSASYALGFRMGQILFYVLLGAAVLRGIFLLWRRFRG